MDGPVVVAMAAKHGTSALPSEGPNSRYALALAEALAMPKVDIRLMFGRVRAAVRQSTGNQQEPYLYGSVGGDLHYFRP